MRGKAGTVVLIIVLLVMIIACQSLSKELQEHIAQNREASAAVSNDRGTVVLDPGHGGIDAGKIGINNAEEKEINLNIALKIKKLLEDNKISVIMTRTADERLADTHKGDLEERVRIMNEEQPSIVVSIHQNSYQSPEVKGPQVFYYTNSVEGRKAAKILQSALNEINTSHSREAKENASYYILKRAEVPVVIAECGFLSNAEEATKLVSDEYQDILAGAIAAGVEEYMD